MADTLAMTIHVSARDAGVHLARRFEGGEYASEGELIEDSLELLRDDEEELRRWEQENVVAAYDELRADPSSAISFEQLQINLAAARRDRLSAG